MNERQSSNLIQPRSQLISKNSFSSSHIPSTNPLVQQLENFMASMKGSANIYSCSYEEHIDKIIHSEFYPRLCSFLRAEPKSFISISNDESHSGISSSMDQLIIKVKRNLDHDKESLSSKLYQLRKRSRLARKLSNRK